MSTETVQAMIEGGKASAAPPLGPALGPLGVNIGQVISKINEKTKGFAGMQVPVKVRVERETKAFEIEVGTPPTSALIKKEAGVEKGSANPLQVKVADLRIENIIKIAKMKEDALGGKTLKEKVKEVMGTCNSMGVMIGGVAAVAAIKHVNEGKYDKEIKEEKTELSAEDIKAMEEERKRLAAETEKRKAELDALAQKILKENEGKERAVIKAKMIEAGIPDAMIKQLLPTDAGAAAKKAEPGAKAAEPAAEKKADKAAEKKPEKKADKK